MSRRIAIFALFAIVAVVGAFLIGRATAPRAAMMSRQLPLIGIASLTSENYVRAVREAGGLPVVLPNTGGNAALVEEYLEVLDGLILPGGADIPPTEYGEEMHESVNLLDEDRFEFEKALTHAWIERTDKPLLGICLGSQWINVASGGSLIQDLPSQKDAHHMDKKHPVSVEAGSRLAGILGELNPVVNSYHHQAVGKLGKGLRVVARAPDGVVEATETTRPNRFLIGVQWHPEGMPGQEAQQRLLKALVKAAAP